MITLSSPKGTPVEEAIFIIEEPSVNRIKMRYADVESQLREAKKGIEICKENIKRLEEIKKEMDKLLK